MNTNPSAKKILCYGDSNTWGRSGANQKRYAINQRWAGILQKHLGNNYEVIEEGLRSRTTILDFPQSEIQGKNGYQYLLPCLQSHNPLHLVILFLGTNDLMTQFQQTPDLIAQNIKKTIHLIKRASFDRNGNPAQILLLSPPIILEKHLKENSKFANSHAEQKSKQLADKFLTIAEKEFCHFFDLAKIVAPGEYDGVHLEPEMHLIIAQELAQLVKKIFNH